MVRVVGMADGYAFVHDADLADWYGKKPQPKLEEETPKPKRSLLNPINLLDLWDDVEEQEL